MGQKIRSRGETAFEVLTAHDRISVKFVSDCLNRKILERCWQLGRQNCVNGTYLQNIRHIDLKSVATNGTHSTHNSIPMAHISLLLGHVDLMDETSQAPAGRGRVEGTKRAKFRELAEKRTNKALEAIRLIGNLSNRQTYSYEDGEVRKIVKALRDAVAEVEVRFNKPSGRGGGDFKL